MVEMTGSALHICIDPLSAPRRTQAIAALSVIHPTGQWAPRPRDVATLPGHQPRHAVISPISRLSQNGPKQRSPKAKPQVAFRSKCILRQPVRWIIVTALCEKLTDAEITYPGRIPCCTIRPRTPLASHELDHHVRCPGHIGMSGVLDTLASVGAGQIYDCRAAG